jgi:hypothetical protein
MGRIKHADDKMTRTQFERAASRWKRIYVQSKPLLEESDETKAAMRTFMLDEKVTEIETSVGTICLRTQTTTDWVAALKSIGLTDAKIEELKKTHTKKSEPFVYPPADWASEYKAKKAAAAPKKRAA